MKFGLLNRKCLVGSHESKRLIIPICHSRVTFYCKGILDLVILSVYRGNERMENTLWDTGFSVLAFVQLISKLQSDSDCILKSIIHAFSPLLARLSQGSVWVP